MAAILIFPVIATAALVPMSEHELANVTGKALFLSSKVGPTGSGTGATPTDYTFYRMGLDTKLAINANIAKLQLGCGGANDSLTTSPACDENLDYVSFMGRTSSNTPGAPGSDFILTRPYVELVTKNDNTKTKREIVGFRIGSQSADGYMSIGREYTSGTNTENGGTCSGAGANDVNCHSGINSLSGYLNAHMTGSVSGPITCFGLQCGNYSAPIDTRVVISGTRMKNIYAAIPTSTSATVLGIPLTINLTAQLTESLRFIHGMALNGTSNFFMSLQDQPVSYPLLVNQDINNDGTVDSYAATANTGWWLNFPSGIELSGLNGTKGITLGQAVGGLITGSISMQNIAVGSHPADNCFGSAMFC